MIHRFPISFYGLLSKMRAIYFSIYIFSQSPQSGQSGGYYMNHPGAPPGGVMAIPQVQHHGGNIQQTTPPQQQAGTPTSPNNSREP